MPKFYVFDSHNTGSDAPICDEANKLLQKIQKNQIYTLPHGSIGNYRWHLVPVRYKVADMLLEYDYCFNENKKVFAEIANEAMKELNIKEMSLIFSKGGRHNYEEVNFKL